MFSLNHHPTPPQTKDVSFFLTAEDEQFGMGLMSLPPGGQESPGEPYSREFPEGFEPLRSEQLAEMRVQNSPIVRNPYMSPLLAPDSMLRGLPPIHIVVRAPPHPDPHPCNSFLFILMSWLLLSLVDNLSFGTVYLTWPCLLKHPSHYLLPMSLIPAGPQACALDPMLDDSVMFAKRLRNVEQPVTLCVVEDLPHGFLSLSQLSRETREATNVCVEQIREVFHQQAPPLANRRHRKLERTDQRATTPIGRAARLPVGIIQEEESSTGGVAETGVEEADKQRNS